MIALFVSNDPAIFDPRSSVRARMRRYAEAIGQLHIVSVATRGAVSAREGNLTLHPVAPGLLRLIRLARVARRVACEYRVEVVSAQDPFEHGLIALYAARGSGAGLHLQLHTDLLSAHFCTGSLKNRFRSLLADYVLPKAHAIRVVSERIQDGIIARYGKRVVAPSVLPVAPAIETEPGAPLPPHRFSFVLLYVGRLAREKRIPDLFAALKVVRNKDASVGLFVVGSGSEEKRLKELSRREGLMDAVIFLGERPDAAGLMKSAHALVQASAYEGYGRTLLEAALARLPIVSTEVGIVGSVLVPEREMLAAPVGDMHTLAHQITRLIGDEQLRRALIVNAEAAALAHLAPLQSLPELVAEDLLHALPVAGNQSVVR